MKSARLLEPSISPGRPAPSRGVQAEDWIVLGLSRAECSEIREGSFRESLAQAEEVNSWAELSGPGVDAVVVLSPDVAPLFPASASEVFQEAPLQECWATILVPWKEPPTRTIRPDGTAQSFCCSSGVFSALLETSQGLRIERLCYCLLEAVMNASVEVQRFVVHQLPLKRPRRVRTISAQTAALIMAHRGPKRFLTAALRSIMGAACASSLTVRVGLDLEDVGDYQDVMETFPEVEFYGVDGAPVGPYVIRQGLIDRSSEDLIIFHDSDDISCHDRFARQAVEIGAGGVEVVGCHELRVDELAQSVQIYRFPLDVSAALALPGSTDQNDRAHEPLLHPTVAMVRSGFVQVGGFSTNRKIANDTQLMLRAYFSLRMKNIDGFLYVRRRHTAALTVAKETALGTPLRHFLGTTWGADFEAVKNGRVKLEQSSLWPRLNPVPHRLTRLWMKQREFLRRPA